MLLWLGVLYDAAKENLVTATPETFQVAQGETKTYKKLINELTRPGMDA